MQAATMRNIPAVVPEAVVVLAAPLPDEPRCAPKLHCSEPRLSLYLVLLPVLLACVRVCVAVCACVRVELRSVT